MGKMLAAFWPAGAPLTRTSTQAKPDFVVLDLLLDPESAGAVLRGAGAVICLAGVTPARAAQTGESLSRNSDLALAGVRLAKGAQARRVFVASSAAVYGASGGVQEESGLCAPVSDYGRAKLAMEGAALALGNDIGQPVTALRIGNVAGADAILGGWRPGMQIDQLADGTTPRRSYIGPRSLAEALCSLSQAAHVPDVLNIAAPAPVEMGALLDAAGLPWAPRPAPAGVIADVTLSTKKLEDQVSFGSEDSTPEGLIAQWRDFQART